MLWVPPAIYQSSCTIDVRYFPFDQQMCVMKFGSWTFNGDQVSLALYNNKNFVDLSDYWKSGTWDIIEVPAYLNVYRNTGQPTETDITFNIIIRRKTLFYTVNLILPTVLISFLCVLVFYLPAEAGEKVSAMATTGRLAHAKHQYALYNNEISNFDIRVRLHWASVFCCHWLCSCCWYRKFCHQHRWCCHSSPNICCSHLSWTPYPFWSLWSSSIGISVVRVHIVCPHGFAPFSYTICRRCCWWSGPAKPVSDGWWKCRAWACHHSPIRTVHQLSCQNISGKRCPWAKTPLDHSNPCPDDDDDGFINDC